MARPPDDAADKNECRHAHPLSGPSEGKNRRIFCANFDRSLERAVLVLGPDVLLSVHEEIEPLKAVWQELERSGDCTPFQTYACLRPGSVI